MIIRKLPRQSKMHSFFVFEANTKKEKVKKTVVEADTQDETDYSGDIESDNPEDLADEIVADDEETDYSDELDTEEEPTEDITDEDIDSETDYSDGIDDGDMSADESDNKNLLEEQNSNQEDDMEFDDGSTDYTDGVSDEEGDENTPNETAPTEEEPTEESNDPQLALKRYNLFRDIVFLYNSNKAFISKLENIIRDDVEGNAIMNIVVGKLRDVGDIVYEFLTVKYMTSTYVESLSFYHTVLATIKLTFRLLQNNQQYLKQ